MKKRKIKGVDVEMSAGNVFADLGLPDADKLKIKSGLVIEITNAVRRLGLSQAEVGRRLEYRPHGRSVNGPKLRRW